MIRLLRIALAAALSLSAASAFAAELLMIEEKHCPWCERWHEEIGGAYPKTEEGRRAPLRQVDIRAPLPDDIALIQRARFTPTFVLLENGEEIGRIEGYPGDHFFWPMLNELLDRLPAEAPPRS